jgi:hypothetical protein
LQAVNRQASAAQGTVFRAALAPTDSGFEIWYVILGFGFMVTQLPLRGAIRHGLNLEAMPSNRIGRLTSNQPGPN